MFMAQVLAANIIIIQDNRPDITITVSEGASMIMVGAFSWWCRSNCKKN